MSTDATRAVYEATHFQRGLNTVSLAGIFDLAHDLHVAAAALGRIAERPAHGSKPADNASRAALLRMAQALLVNERNQLLDRFAAGWQVDPNSLDNGDQAHDHSAD